MIVESLMLFEAKNWISDRNSNKQVLEVINLR
jgi:hypothetical protein